MEECNTPQAQNLIELPDGVGIGIIHCMQNFNMARWAIFAVLQFYFLETQEHQYKGRNKTELVNPFLTLKAPNKNCSRRHFNI